MTDKKKIKIEHGWTAVYSSKNAMISATVNQVDNKKATTNDFPKKSVLKDIEDNYHYNTKYNKEISNESESITTSSPNLSEKISALFPKCRPKNDGNFYNKSTLYADNNSTKLIGNKYGTTVSASHTLSRTIDLNIKNHNQPIDSIGYSTNHTIGSPDRTIHISSTIGKMNNQSQDNMSNLSGLANYQSRNGGAGNHRGHSNNDYHSNSIDHFIWEKRRSPNTTPASTVLNSPDLTEVHHYSHNPVQHQIKVGRSPVNQTQMDNGSVSSKKSVSPISPVVTPVLPSGKPLALVSDGEVVVFDDIGDNWRNTVDGDFVQQQKKQQMQHQSQHFHHLLFNAEEDNDNVDRRNNSDTNLYSSDISSVTKMIGKAFTNRLQCMHAPLYHFTIN